MFILKFLCFSSIFGVEQRQLLCADGDGNFATYFPLSPIFIAIGPHRESRQYHIDKKKQAQASRERLLGNNIK